MRRRLFTILSAVSLLLCVAVAGMWVRSYWMVDQAEGGYWPFQPVTNQPATTNMTLERGKAMEINHFRGVWLIRKLDRLVRPKWPEGRHWRFASHRIEDVAPFYQDEMGAKYGWNGILAFGSVSSGELRLVVSDVLLLLTTLAMPAVWAASHLRRRARIRHDHCPSCGYDLRATPERCPDCGETAHGS